MKTLARARDTIEILSRLEALRSNSSARWGRMCAHQMVCHLTDGYRVLTGERPAPLAAPRLPRPLMKWIALYAPLKWPAGIPTTPELDQYVDGTRPVSFEADVAELATLLGHISRRDHGQFARHHPIFGRMSRSAWLRWAYLHADHHFRQFGV